MEFWAATICLYLSLFLITTVIVSFVGIDLCIPISIVVLLVYGMVIFSVFCISWLLSPLFGGMFFIFSDLAILAFSIPLFNFDWFDFDDQEAILMVYIISTSSLFVDIAFKVMEFISIPAVPSVPSFSVVKKLAMHASKHIHHVVGKAHTLPMYELFFIFVWKFIELTVAGYILGTIVAMIFNAFSMQDRYEGGSASRTLTGTSYNFGKSGSYLGFSNTTFTIPGDPGTYIGPGSPISLELFTSIRFWVMVIVYIVGFTHMNSF